MKGWILALLMAAALILAAIWWCQQGEAPIDSSRALLPVEARPNDLRWSFDYEDERLASLQSPGGRITRFSWEDRPDQGESLRVLFSDGGEVRHHYDRFGRRLARKDWMGEVRYEYDGFGRLRKVIQKGESLLERQYDAQDRPVLLLVADNFKTEWKYDFLGRLSERETPFGKIQYRYSPGQGMRTRTLPNGLRTIWKYDADGRLEQLNHVDPSDSIIARFRYQYLPDGRLAEVREWDRTEGSRNIGYRYDKLGRLIEVETENQPTVRFAYDGLGNRSTLQISGSDSLESRYDWAGRLIELDRTPTQHDEAGNLVGYRKGLSLRYNHQNQLAQVSRGERIVHYEYNGDGVLISRTHEGRRSRLLVVPGNPAWQPLMQQEPDREAVYYLWEDGVPLVEVTGKSPKYYLHDHLGSARYAVFQDGTIADTFDYTPFGAPVHDAGDQTRLRPGFAGMLYDPVAEVYLTLGRAYAPALGRFLQVDPAHQVPMGAQNDLSPYLYCGNDPVNFHDRSGLFPIPVSRLALDWPELLRMQEQQRQLQIQRQLIQQLADQTQLERRNQEALSGLLQSQLHELQGQLFSDFTATSVRLANLYRGARGLGAYSGNLPGLANRSFSAANLLFGKLLSTVQLTADTLKYIGTSAMMINPLRYPMQQTSTGWHGAGEFQFPEGVLRYDETLTTAAPRWWHSGSIDRQRHLQLDSPFGRYEETLTSSTPASSPLERFMMHHFPLGSYYDPASSRISQRRSTQESYRVVRSNGVTRVEPLGADVRLQPSPVGGVYLKGASDWLRGLGDISGLALDDETGSFSLIGREGDKWTLPPLTLDDLVVVFRSVYLTGEGPFVSIDPDREDPDGPWMRVRLHPELEDSYVGWVLFQADRIMKAYSLGEDNVTRQPVESEIVGYRSLLQLGHSDSETWERYWIKPAGVQRRESSSGKLMLLDVPLRVATQNMVMRGGELVPAEGAEPSAEALYFSEWFSDNYSLIEKEVFLQPPHGSSRVEAVPVFSELRRIATLTAAAELLKSGGVPLPQWMNEYVVARVKVDPKTPAIVVADPEDRRIIRDGREFTVRRQIYGGVDLSPKEGSVKTFRSDEEAIQLNASLARNQAGLADFGTRLLPMGDGKRIVSTLPGSGSRVPLPLRYSETDLTIELPGGDRFELRRYFNSFFQPSDVFGTSPWTLDLPRLEKHPVAGKSKGEIREYKLTYQLESPLGSVTTTFQNRAPVPELGTELIVPLQPDSAFLAMGSGQHPVTEANTHRLFLRDGGQWHFDEEGRLVAAVTADSTILYFYSPQDRISRIEILAQGRVVSRLYFEYDSRGWVQAIGGSGQTARYSYDSEGLLTRVDLPHGRIDYSYLEKLLAQIRRNGEDVQHFQYNQLGQLEREEQADGSVWIYDQKPEPDGRAVIVRSDPDGKIETEARIDRSSRPVNYRFADGIHYHWYRSHESVRLVMIRPDGVQREFSCGTDRACKWTDPQGGEIRAVYNAAESTFSLRKGNLQWLRFHSPESGRCSSVRTEGSEARFRFSQTGNLDEILMVDPDEPNEKITRWLQLIYDSRGGPARIRDYSGSDISFTRDRRERLTRIQSKRGNLTIERDSTGRVVQLTSSSGLRQQRSYDSGGLLSRVRLERGSQTATLNIEEGRVQHVREFSGWEGRIAYEQEPGLGLVLRSIEGSGLKLEYKSDRSGRHTQVDCNDTFQLSYEYDEAGRLTRFTRSSARSLGSARVGS